MTPRPVSFRHIDPPPNEAASEGPRPVQIVDTFGFEVIEQTSPVAPANSDVRCVGFEHLDIVPFATTLRRIA